MCSHPSSDHPGSAPSPGSLPPRPQSPHLQSGTMGSHSDPRAVGQVRQDTGTRGPGNCRGRWICQTQAPCSTAPSPSWPLPSLLTATSSKTPSGFQGRLLSKEPGMFTPPHPIPAASLVAQSVKNLPAMQETQVRSLGREDPLEKEMATHSNILPWRIPWTEEPGGLQSTGSQELDTT